MTVKLYVGNLSYSTSEETLRKLLDRNSEVASCDLILDKFTGKARGFAFVEMASRDAADQAIKEFHDYELEGRRLVVNEARPHQPRSGGFGGYGSKPPGGGNFGGGRKSGKGSRRGARNAKRDKKAFW